MKVFNFAGVSVILWTVAIVLVVVYTEKSIKELFVAPLQMAPKAFGVQKVVVQTFGVGLLGGMKKVAAATNFFKSEGKGSEKHRSAQEELGQQEEELTQREDGVVAARKKNLTEEADDRKEFEDGEFCELSAAASGRGDVRLCSCGGSVGFFC